MMVDGMEDKDMGAFHSLQCQPRAGLSRHGPWALIGANGSDQCGLDNASAGGKRRGYITLSFLQ